MSKKWWLFLVALAAMPFAASAKQTWDDKDAFVYVPKEQVVSGNLYRVGEVVQVDGTVEGDVIAAAGTLKINGTVTGDVLAVAGRVIITGPVLGDVRVAAGQVDLDGVIGKNLNVFAGSARLGRQSAVGYEALVFAGELDTEGVIKKDVRGAVGMAVLAGTVEHDVWLKADRLVLQSSAVIGGNLTYASPQAAQVMSNATIKGEVNFKPFEREPWDNGAAKRIAFGFFITFTLVKLISLWLLALVLFWVVPKKMHKIMREVEAGIWPNLGIGLVAIIGMPVLSLLLAMTVVGMPLAVAVLCLYALALLVGTVAGATFVGEWIIKRLSDRHWREVSPAWASLLGLTLLVLAWWIPVAGFLLVSLVVVTGLGALLQFEQMEMRRWR